MKHVDVVDDGDHQRSSIDRSAESMKHCRRGRRRDLAEVDVEVGVEVDVEVGVDEDSL